MAGSEQVEPVDKLPWPPFRWQEWAFLSKGANLTWAEWEAPGRIKLPKAQKGFSAFVQVNCLNLKL